MLSKRSARGGSLGDMCTADSDERPLALGPQRQLSLRVTQVLGSIYSYVECHSTGLQAGEHHFKVVNGRCGMEQTYREFKENAYFMLHVCIFCFMFVVC